MDVKQAILYPYRKGNFLRCVGIPTGLSLLFSLAFVAGVAGLIVTSLGAEQLVGIADNPMALVGILVPMMAFGAAIMVPFALLMNGYFWNLVATWQAEGMDAPPPAWKGHFKDYLVDGFHAILAMVVLFIPMVLGYITVGFLMPFAMAPYFEAAQERRIGAVMKSLPQAMAQAKGQYMPLLGGLWMCILISVVASFVSSVLSITVVGPMLLQVAMGVTCAYLLTQQYGITGLYAGRSKGGQPMPGQATSFGMGSGAMGLGQSVGGYSASTPEDNGFSMELDDTPYDEDTLTYMPPSDSQVDAVSATSDDEDLNSRWMSEAPQEYVAKDQIAEPKADKKAEKPAKEKKTKPNMKMLKLQQGDNPWLRHKSTL